jgi:hypothetical protein
MAHHELGERVKKQTGPGIDQVLMFLILAVGAWLRCFHWQEIPFTHDEFSAIIRTQYSTFGELIEKGVKPDGHPAGIQVFLFYWVKLFGTNEFIVKLPFIICGLLSVWLIYKIGKEWFNSAVGLIAASFVSFLQYPVMYSQIARPYSSGLCFSLLMVFFWTELIFHPERRTMLNRVGYVIAGALCAYNHHFTLLFAFLVGATGLFFCQGKNLRIYLLLNLLIFILYIPHLPIFFYQLNTGGLEGWLQKPRLDFLLHFVQYIFQFSVFVFLLIIVLVSLELYWYKRIPRIRKKFLIISLIWFLLPFLIGYIYSKLVSSVLQYSVLIFSFPFLLFLLFGYFKTGKAFHKIIVVGLIAAVIIPSLIFERKHYELFYHNPYREFVLVPNEADGHPDAQKCPVIVSTPAKINNYYLAKFSFPGSRYLYEDSLKIKGRLQLFLDSTRGQYLGYGSTPSSPWENYALIRDKFPYLIKHLYYSGGDFYLFSRIKPPLYVTEYFYESMQDFETTHPGWFNQLQPLCKDSLPLAGRRSYWSNDTLEFSPTFIFPLRDLVRTRNDIIDISVRVRIPMVFPGAWLVTTVSSGGSTIFWRSVPINGSVKPGNIGNCHITLRVSDLDIRHHQLLFSTYIWNPKKVPFEMDDFTIRVRPGNPFLYGLFRQIKD